MRSVFGARPRPPASTSPWQFGFLGTLIAARQLGPEGFGLLAIVIVATGFFQSLLDLTAEEALVKYGFDYAAAESWGPLRRLFRQALVVKAAGGIAAGLVLVALAPVADSIFGGTGLTVPFLHRCAIATAPEPGRCCKVLRSSSASATTCAPGSSPPRWA